MAIKKKEETFKVKGRELLKKVKQLIKEGNVRKITIKDKSGKSLIVLPLTIGVVAVTVEASSMAAGQYSSEKAVHQMDKTGKHTDSLIIGALIMFLSYISAGMIPIVPTIIFEQPIARIISIIFAFLGLFVIGYIKGKIVKQKPLRSAIELFVIGGIAMLVGVIVGQILKV